MLDPTIAVQLRRRGWDVEAIQADHPELLGADDAVVLETATQLGRALVTDNLRHFFPIHQQRISEDRPHAGLVFADARSYPRSKKTIGLWVRGLEALLKEHTGPWGDYSCEWLP
jgi:hypothetical protein